MGDESDTVAAIAQLYLGNILYALELAAISLEEQQKATDASFYRGIARINLSASALGELGKLHFG